MIDVPRIVFPQGHTALGLQEDGRLQLWTVPPAPSSKWRLSNVFKRFEVTWLLLSL